MAHTKARKGNRSENNGGDNEAYIATASNNPNTNNK